VPIRRTPPLGRFAAVTIAALAATLLLGSAARLIAHPRDTHSAPAATGQIEGTVEISSVLSARRPRIRIYGDAGPGSVPPSRAGVDTLAELRNVVVYVQSDRSHPLAAADTRHYAMAQQDEQFVPHILPVVRGATVEFPNEDDVYHNVFSLSSAKSFDLGRYPRGASRSVSFNAPGTVQVFCHIHADMSAVILVLDNQFFATPDAAGHFVIDSLPPGEYSIVGWHERIKPVVRHVTVTPGGTAHVDFNIPLPSPAASGGRE
jgi:plastocyanin